MYNLVLTESSFNGSGNIMVHSANELYGNTVPHGKEFSRM
jgi:hypothetical protein